MLGVDIGGTGTKGALVDLGTGTLAAARKRFDTPRPATPQALAKVFADLCEHFEYRGPIGCAFPGVVTRHCEIATAVNLDDSWVGLDAATLFGSAESPVTMINDADAAGLAEMRFGAGAGNETGTVVVVTIGTGLGTAVFTDGHLVANTELGHIEIDGVDAESRAAGRVMKQQGLTIEAWAPRFEKYLRAIEDLVWPNLFILGGGISKEWDRWGSLIDVRTPTTPAKLRNHAGIIGAGLAATGDGSRRRC